jgi:hypothetical protein
MKKQISTLFAALLATLLFAQSPKTVVVEHFTNTRCSICASKNPGFYQTMSNYPQVIHIAIHPSAPYSNCFFNQQNVAENDGRTQFYSGNYGSTPRAALNGMLLPIGGTILNNTTLDTALGQTSPVLVRVSEQQITIDSVRVKVVVHTTGSLQFTPVKLFVAVTEEPVNYNAPNGETVHHDVFRKALTDVVGDAFALAALNDSTLLEYTYYVKSGWLMDNLRTVAFVQKSSNKYMLNAGRSEGVEAMNTTGINQVAENAFNIYPNPVTDYLIISGYANAGMPIQVLGISGRVILERTLNENTTQIDVSNLRSGFYFLRAAGSIRKFVKQ